MNQRSGVSEILKRHEAELLSAWLIDLNATNAHTEGRISGTTIEGQAREFLRLLGETSRNGTLADIDHADSGPLRTFLEDISRSRAMIGFAADQTATFVFSFKKPLFAVLRQEFATDPKALAEETWSATEHLDKLGLFTFKTFQRSREDIIHRQQDEMLELSIPVVKLWDGILALPIVGTLDSARAQVVMESLLQKVIDTGSEIAIIDITGVPTVDTLVAQHLLRTVTAIRLMGADCIISGIRPQIAQTIVHLGIDLEGITTKANLADALSIALKRSGFAVTKSKP